MSSPKKDVLTQPDRYAIEFDRTAVGLGEEIHIVRVSRLNSHIRNPKSQIPPFLPCPFPDARIYAVESSVTRHASAMFVTGLCLLTL